MSGKPDGVHSGTWMDFGSSGCPSRAVTRVINPWRTGRLLHKARELSRFRMQGVDTFPRRRIGWRKSMGLPVNFIVADRAKL
jgi:hypothetical protein